MTRFDRYRRTGLLALVLAAMSLPALAEKQVYRWEDDRGNQVNSDRPPGPGIPYEVISTESGMVRRVNTSDPLPTGADTDAKAQEKPDKPLAHTQQPEVEKNATYCEQAKQNLKTLETAPRVRMRGDDGEYRYLTDEERSGQMKNARDTIKIHCD